jgi:putative glycosyltransferase (TIGR04372 family)
VLGRAVRRLLRWAVLGCGLVALGILRLLRPLVRVRVGELRWIRIGEFAARMDLYLRRRADGRFRGEWHLFVDGGGEPANRPLVEMVRRHVFVAPGRLARLVYDVLRTRTEHSPVWLPTPFDQNEFDEFNRIPSPLTLSAADEARGRRILEDLDIDATRPYVCFHSRDHAYLDQVHAWRSREAWAYHDYRDCDIKNYLPAAEYLAARGVPAVRVGYMVAEPLAGVGANVIDYATRHRSEFGDAYLLARCKFFLANTAGLLCIPQIFGIPVAAANWIPLRFALLGRHDIFIPKKLWSVARRRLLTFREIFEGCFDAFLTSQEYERAGLEVVENSADEILALCREMDERLDGRWNETDEDRELQARYRGLMPRDHHSVGFPSRIGAQFLRDTRELLGR